MKDVFSCVSTVFCFVGSLIIRPSGSKVFVSGEESHHSEIRHFLNGYNTAVPGNLASDCESVGAGAGLRGLTVSSLFLPPRLSDCGLLKVGLPHCVGREK